MEGCRSGNGTACYADAEDKPRGGSIPSPSARARERTPGPQGGASEAGTGTAGQLPPVAVAQSVGAPR